MPAPLGRKIGRGLGFSVINTVVGRLGTLVLGIVLARLVAPEQFGVFAAALVVTTVLMSISELGVSVPLVRAIKQSEVNRLAPVVTTLSILSGCVLAGLMALSAPVLATALGAPAATDPIRVLSLVLITAGLTAVPVAVLTREFMQGRKLIGDLSAFVVMVVVAIVLAVLGHGVWALVWSRLASHVVGCLVLTALAPRRYRPGWDAGIAAELLRFGLPLAGASIVAIGLLEVDYAVVGPMLGPAALGIYVLAFNISGWPVNGFSIAVRAVSLPGFSQLRDDQARYTASFGQALGILSVPVIPFCVLLGVLANPIVQVVYGDRWSAAAAALVFLAALGAGRVATQLAYDFLVSAGATKAAFRLSLVWLLGLVPALVVGAQLNGIAGVALAHVVVLVLVVVPTHLVALRRVGVSIRSIAVPLARPAFGGACMCAVAVAVQASLAGGQLEQLVVTSAAALTVYFGIVVVPLWQRHRRGELLGVLDLGRTQPTSA